MYNMTLKYIKKEGDTNKKLKLNWMHIRGQLKIERKKLVKKYNGRIHDIDHAIKLACQNYKSAFTNYKIKTFRIRYWSYRQPIKIMDLEKESFKSGSICKNKLGQVEAYLDGDKYDLKQIQSDCRLQYNTKFKKYILYVPIKIEPIDIMNRNKIVSLDPGIRTFMSGISENKILEIGTTCQIKL